MRPDHSVLIEQGELALDFEHPLDDEHNVRPAGVVFIKAQPDRMLQRPRQETFAEFGDLLVVTQHDRVLADKIDAADVAVEIDADQRPIQAGGDLLDMSGFAGAVIATDLHSSIEGEAGEDRERGVVIKAVGVVEIGNVLTRLAESGNLEITVDPEGLTDRDCDIGLIQGKPGGRRRWLHGWHSSLVSWQLSGEFDGRRTIVQLK